ncbi:MAG: hypothetical protein AAFW75_24160 [Cyanobacteria bacterium J06636_16]
MKDFPIRNIFLPAALAASAVFSAFTLPAALQRSTTHAVDLPIITQKSQMGLGQVHKDVAIPYIGTVIVFSAGAGMATAELIRKWWAIRSAAARAAQQEAACTAAYTEADTELAEADLTEAIAPLATDVPATALPLADADLIWPTAVADAAETPSTAEKTATYKFPEQLPAAAWAEPAIAQPEAAAAVDMTVVIFPGQYERCRIQVPHLREQLYAIEFDEKFYSLLSAGISKEQALAAVTQLAKEERPAILTQMNEGHAVWVLEPQAKRVFAA